MSLKPIRLGAADSDDVVDNEIRSCLDPSAPRSFFVYAGAGSGKTRSLKGALEYFRDTHGAEFRSSGSRIAVITFTRAAAEEIAHRVGDDSLFPISTIHSFSWSLIGGHHGDIREWLLNKLPQDLADLKDRHSRGRGGQAALDRERAMAAIQRRIEFLGTPRKFTYNPNGDNFGADSLSHTEVIAITADFLIHKVGLQAVLINSFPFLLIDESQDTAKALIQALFQVAELHRGSFALGLLGDAMQRIYTDGQTDLGSTIPEGWACPVKRMNHRSGRRIVQLGNAVRAEADGQEQWARDDSESGIVRLFVARSDVADKPALERRVCQRMAVVCEDERWAGEFADVKTLTLEHHMAATRHGFADLFAALDADKRSSAGLRRGDLAGLRFFSELVAPLIRALRRDDQFAAMSHLRATSPLLRPKRLAASEAPDSPLDKVRAAVNALVELESGNRDVTFLDLLCMVNESGLFEVPAVLMPFVASEKDSENAMDEGAAGATTLRPQDGAEQEETGVAASLTAWRAVLGRPYAEIEAYSEYVADRSPYGTHQGVKGLEFDRVLVIMDDSDARGFLFSYDKLLGTKALSDGDRQKLAAGEETGIDRTRRLLYVTVTRAKRSLALVAYTDQPQALASRVVEKCWFTDAEVELLE